jgi:hypothetical protein
LGLDEIHLKIQSVETKCFLTVPLMAKELVDEKGKLSIFLNRNYETRSTFSFLGSNLGE